MSQVAQPELITVNVDGKEVAVPKGTNAIEAARLVGVDVPHYCYHPKLSVVGNCRMCLIEMGMPAVDPATKAPIMDPATGKQKINWIPRPQIGCATNASPGLHIRTNTPQIKDCREGVMEFLLVNHPLDCPICDQAGECKLQEQSTAYGRGYSRYIEQKNVKPKRTQLGPRVMLDDERCILCSRCIRFTQGDRQGRRAGLRRPRQLLDSHLLSGPRARQQLLAQHGRHLPRRRTHERRISGSRCASGS
jgi:NADH-quinone oxidoreductase subunit G